MEVLDYKEDTGIFTWRVRTAIRNSVGSIAGSIMNNGYHSITVDGKKYLAHRLAWFYCHGEWPGGQIDHANRDRSDNRIANLRRAAVWQNTANADRSKVNTTGHVGIYRTRHGNFAAGVSRERRKFNLGVYDTAEDASLAYRIAAKIIHGEYAVIDTAGETISYQSSDIDRMWKDRYKLKDLVRSAVFRFRD